MPSVFKALASIAAWVLFILGLFGIVVNFVMGTLGGELFVVGVVPSLMIFVAFALSMVSLILSVCAMKLRQMLE